MRRPPLKWLVSGAVALGILAAGLALSFQIARPWLAPGATAPAQNTLPLAPEAWRGDIDYHALDARLVGLMADSSMTGLAVAVVEDGRLAFVRGYGVTSVDGGEPVGPDTVFRWASLSKTASGALSAQLASAGVFSLTDRLDGFSTTLRLPGDAQRELTIEHLLSQQTGLPKNAYDGRLEDGEPPTTIRAALSEVGRVCPPGTCHTYQNLAFDTIAEVITEATGEPYAEVLHQRLFAPLGMTHTTVGYQGLVQARRWARPHHRGERLEPGEAYYRVPAAAGVNSTITDLAIWMQALMGLHPAVLPRAVLDEAQRARVATASPYGRLAFARELKGAGYGLGIRSFTYRGHRLLGHSGGVSGYRATMMFDPATATGIVMLWNSDGNLPFRFQAEFMDLAYGLPFTDWLDLEAASAPNGDPTAANLSAPAVVSAGP